GGEVEDWPQPPRAQRLDPRIVFGPGTDRRIELVMVGNVVAVETIRARLKIRRRITIADPERVEIRHDLPRLREGELPVELQPVGRSGYARMLGGHERGKT